jgi:hypothetical protein
MCGWYQQKHVLQTEQLAVRKVQQQQQQVSCLTNTDSKNLLTTSCMPAPPSNPLPSVDTGVDGSLLLHRVPKRS